MPCSSPRAWNDSSMSKAQRMRPCRACDSKGSLFPHRMAPAGIRLHRHQAGHHAPPQKSPPMCFPGARLHPCGGLWHFRMPGSAYGRFGYCPRGRCRNNLVESCQLSDIGGSGIMVGWRDLLFSGKAPSPGTVPCRRTGLRPRQGANRQHRNTVYAGALRGRQSRVRGHL